MFNTLLIITIILKLRLAVEFEQETTTLLLPNTTNKIKPIRFILPTDPFEHLTLTISCSDELKNLKVYHEYLDLCSAGSISTHSEQLDKMLNSIYLSINKLSSDRSMLTITYTLTYNSNEESIPKQQTINQRFKVASEIGLKIISQRLEKNEIHGSQFRVNIAKINDQYFAMANVEDIHIRIVNHIIVDWFDFKIKNGYVHAIGKFPDGEFESTNVDFYLFDSKTGLKSKTVKIHVICNSGEIQHMPIVILMVFLLVLGLLLYFTYVVLQCCRDELKKANKTRLIICVEKEKINKHDNLEIGSYDGETDGFVKNEDIQRSRGSDKNVTCVNVYASNQQDKFSSKEHRSIADREYDISRAQTYKTLFNDA